MNEEKDIKRARKILNAYFNDTLPADLESDILSWIIHEGNRAGKDAELEKLWNEMVGYEEHPANERQILELLAEIKECLCLPPVEMKPAGEKPAMKTISVRKRHGRRIALRVAAVIFPLLVLGGAMIYLGTGRRAPEELTMVASGDKALEMTLPDGSLIWLDKGATLSYAGDFENERTVGLGGRAYFKVSRDDARPFVVNAGALSVCVLGTEFSVSNLPDDRQTTVTLASGKVRVDIGGESYTMDRRSRLTYDDEYRTVVINDLAAGESSGWHKAEFEYVALDSVFNALSRRYGIEIIRDGAAIAAEMVTLKMEGGETLDTVLSRLSRITARFGYRIEDEKVIIDVK